MMHLHEYDLFKKSLSLTESVKRPEHPAFKVVSLGGPVPITFYFQKQSDAEEMFAYRPGYTELWKAHYDEGCYFQIKKKGDINDGQSIQI